MARSKFPATPIDPRDDRGRIAFTEFQKRINTKKNLKENLRHITVKDWILIFIAVNGGEILKVPLFKHLFLFTERVGIPEENFSWYPWDFGPHSIKVEESLDGLINEGMIDIEKGTTNSGREYKKINIINKNVYKVMDTLSNDTKELVFSIVNEFQNMDLKDLLHYVYSASPEYATKSKFVK